MNILVTGGSGNVGSSTIEALIEKGFHVRILDIRNRRTEKRLGKFKKNVSIFWGDIRNTEDCETALDGIDTVVHTAAIIPPLADHEPALAYEVNVNGTRNLCAAIARKKEQPGLVYTSSIAVYGDRISSPFISVSDEPNPNPRDTYAKQKLEAEEVIRSTVSSWLILRLSYITSMEKLSMDPLLFELPPATSIEIMDTRDTGLALANACARNDLWGRMLHLAGGRECRIGFGDYLDEMTELFGLGRKFFPREAFAPEGLHCGFMDTDETERLLRYQRHTLADYFANVKKKCRITSFFARPFRRIIRHFILRQSPYYATNTKKLRFSL